MDEIEVAAKHIFHELDPGLLSALLVGQAQVDHLVYTVRMQQGQSPDDERAPVMADEGGVFVSVVVQKCDEVTRQVLDVVVRHFDRAGRIAVTPLVRCDDVVAGRGEGGHLVAPGEGVLRPAVAEHDGLSRVFSARFEDFEFHTVDRDEGGLGKIGWIEHHISSLGAFASGRPPR